jgi:hypothetical protein
VSRPGACLVVALVLRACLPAGAGAAQSAEIKAKLTPEHLGAGTTVSFGFELADDGGAPAPLSAIQLAFPSDLGLATSGLGLASCSPSELEIVGPQACPADSRMGSGSATAEIVIPSQTVKENVSLGLFAGPSSDGYLHILVYVSGSTPVVVETLLSGVVMPGRLEIAVPALPSFREGPDVVVARMQLTLGGHLTYYEHVAGRIVSYHPAGVGLPSRCPAGGFAFAATFAFMDGSRASAHTAVPCPPGARRRGTRRRVKT